MDPKLKAFVNSMLGIEPVLHEGAREFASQAEELLNEQFDAIRRGDYKRANALGLLVQNMTLSMIADALYRQR